MPRVRLFGPAREAAGTSDTEVAGSTVAQVLDETIRRFGAAFADVAARSKVWVNGIEAPDDAPVGETDEIAVLPPISGGC